MCIRQLRLHQLTEYLPRDEILNWSSPKHRIYLTWVCFMWLMYHCVKWNIQDKPCCFSWGMGMRRWIDQEVNNLIFCLWLCLLLQYPYIGEHFSKLMAPLLLLVDDYEVCCILDITIVGMLYYDYILIISNGKWVFLVLVFSHMYGINDLMPLYIAQHFSKS